VKQTSSIRKRAKSEIDSLRERLVQVENALAEAQDVIRAIQAGEVDAVVVSGPKGEQVFSLTGAEYAYRALVEAINEGAATISLDGTVLYCNRRLAELVDIPLEQIIGNSASQLFGGESVRIFQAMMERSLNGDPAKAEIDLPWAEGRRPVYVSLREMNAPGAALCMVVTDLSEHKKRDELIAAGKLARSILESAAEAIAVCDETGQIISANKAMEELCGFNPLFRFFDEAVPLEFPDDSKSRQGRFSIASALGDAAYKSTEVTLSRSDGDNFWLLLSSSRIAGTSGVVGCVLTLTDITGRKREEEALRNSERLYRAIGESIDYGVWMCAPDGRNIYASDSFLKMVGMTQQECSDFGWGKVLHPDDAERTIAAWKECVRTGNTWECEHRYRGMDGEWHPVLARGVPVRGDDGQVLCWAGLNLDVSNLKRAEQALIQSEKLASVGRMASTIAHEINNPLETIGHAIYLAMTDPDSSDQSKSYLDLAVQELERVAHITKQTLAFHRENQKSAWIDLRESVDGVLRLYAGRLKSRGVKVEKRYSAVPHINAIAGEIRQIVSNLLSNSMDAVQKGGIIRLHVSPAVTSNGSTAVRLSVADTGSGITPEERKKIFEPFFTTKEIIGTGLGLWVTKQIVEKHGGTIRVRSKPASATVFSVVFPVRREKPEAG